MFLVHNERIKLTANWFSELGTALMAAGVFAPMAALVYGLSRLESSLFPMSVAIVACFAIGTALHLVGRRALARLRE